MDGTLDPLTLFIDSRLNATWQGRLLHRGREYRFSSELELLLLLNRLAGGAQIDWEGTQ